MKIRYFLLTLFLFNPILQEKEQDKKSNLDTVSFQLLNNIPVVECMINDKGPFQFIVDTGCYDMCARPFMTKKLGLDAGKHLVTFSIGKAVLKNLEFKIENCQQWAQFSGELKDVCGLVGYPFLKNFAVTLDYKSKNLTFKTLSDSDKKNGELSFTTNKNGWVFMKCSINGKGPFDCMIDTGCEFNFITSKIAKQTGVKFDYKARTTLKSLSIEGHEVENVTAQDLGVTGVMEGGLPECLIGTPYLCNFKTTIDYKNKTIRFDKSDSAVTFDEYTIPFKSVLGAPIVKCKINDKGPFDILIDLGSYDVAVRPYMSKKLGMKMGTHNVNFSIGKSEIKDLKFSIADAPQWEQFEINEELKDVAGVCGYPFLKNFIVTIDYGKNKLTLAPHDSKSDDSARKGETNIKFDLNECRIFIKAEINGKGPYTLMLDSGANYIFLNQKTAKGLALKFDSNKTAKLKSVCIKGAAVNDLEAKLIPGGLEEERIMEKEFGKSDGIIGHPFLKHFAVTIDYEKKILKLFKE